MVEAVIDVGHLSLSLIVFNDKISYLSFSLNTLVPFFIFISITLINSIFLINFYDFYKT